ncbi:4-phosphopantetheinyl transferase [Escherichia coli]|nr:4-phosphopantetheinyl transferase [Escherichia coli]KUG73647.1 4-phosphopantetheinyl transferase [Escherichia coli]KUH10686.1 4-phosphopantetheinyl transferase [Escherichia coli]
MFCYFKFILWINCEAELIREEKQKKTPQTAAFRIVCMFLAGCGVNALSGLQKHANSIYCRDHVGLISVAHQAI